MFPNQIDLWWCCLNPRERNLVILMLPFFSSTDAYFPRASFDAYWASVGMSGTGAMAMAFINLYALTEGVHPLPGGGEIPVLFYDIGYWTQVLAFSITAAFTCTEPCKVLTFGKLV